MDGATSNSQLILGFAALTAFLVGFSAFRWHDQLDKRSDEMGTSLERLNRACLEPNARPYPIELRRVAHSKSWQSDPVAGFTLFVASLASLLTAFLAAIGWNKEWTVFEMTAVVGAAVFHCLVTLIAILDYCWVHRRRQGIDETNPGAAMLEIERILLDESGSTDYELVRVKCDQLRSFLPGWCWIDLFEAEATVAAKGKIKAGQIDGLERCLALTQSDSANDSDALIAWIWAQSLRGKSALIETSQTARLANSIDPLRNIVERRISAST